MTALVKLTRNLGLGLAAFSLLAAFPAQAQFGGLSLGSLGKKSSTADTSTTNGCPEGKKKSTGAAIFVDAGDSYLGSDFTLHVGVGAGIRWKSPVGVLRLDLAYPVESIDASGWQLHFNIGADF